MNAVVDTELLKALVRSAPADRLAGVRNAAVRKFAATGLPTTRDEDWRYTNLAPAIAISNRWLGDANRVIASEPGADALQAYAEIQQKIDAHWIHIVDGTISANSIGTLASISGNGVRVERLRETANDASIYMDDGIASLNAALLTDGLRISLADGASIDKPVGIFISGSTADASVFWPVRLLLHVGVDASLDLVEVSSSAGNNAAFSSIVTQLELETGATVNFVRLQQFDADQIQVSKVRGRLGQDSNMNYCSFDLGGSLLRNDIDIDIDAAGAAANLTGLYLAGDGQHIDNHTRVDHRVGPASSHEEFRGILQGRSRCVFNGKAIVHKGADGTDAHQSNHNLLLSRSAEIDTKPELEIYADDVKCSHGATVGQLDDDALFYLRSRGLDLSEATALLTRAFADNVLDSIPVEACREYVSSTLHRHLEKLIDDDRDDADGD